MTLAASACRLPPATCPQGEGQYGMVAKIRTIMEDGGRRVPINIDDLREYDPEMARDLVANPNVMMPALDKALQETAAHIGQSDGKKETEIKRLRPSFTGSFGNNLVSPRGLVARLLGQMVCVEGIVTRAGLVQSKMVSSVHHCKANGKFHTRNYADSMTPGADKGSASAVPMAADEDGNPLGMEFGLCTYKDHQKLTIQEMPERSPHGQLPRSVEVVADEDLADRCKPGDRVQIVGMFMPKARQYSGGVASTFENYLYASSVNVFGYSVSKISMTSADITAARSLAKRDDVLAVLSRSLAPSIYGHDYVKKALLLQLLGGAEKNLENGTHLRGDVNILMVGDPSTAKSQLLRFAMNIAPLAVSTTGRGSSGVGLTAAVTSDKDTGERRLEAGAMVMADRGIVCIDEFDKMSELDRVAIHEVMEQQTVTIAKAGIHASLNARCSVLAAANPVYGQYAKDKKPQENIGLPDSLLSRFDMLFVVLDTVEPELDRCISDHVLRMHRYQKSGQEGVPVSNTTGFPGEGLGGSDDESDPVATPMWEKFNPLLHGGAAAGGNVARGEELLNLDFVKKYLHYAKKKCAAPVMTEEAREMIAVKYAELRGRQDGRTLPVTARSLETLIRLSTAHAKARLSATVEEQDAAMAVEMVSFALYHDIDAPGSGKENGQEATEEGEQEARDDDDGGDDGGAEEDAEDAEDAERKRAREEQMTDEEDMEQDEENVDGRASKRGKVSGDDADGESVAAAMDPDSERFKTIMSKMSGLFETTRKESLTIAELLSELNDDAEVLFGRAEVEKGLAAAEELNRIMYLEDDGEIHKV